MQIVLKNQGGIFGYNFTEVITALSYILPALTFAIFLVCFLYFTYQQKQQEKRDDPDTVGPRDHTNIHRLAVSLEEFWRLRIAQKDIIFTVYCDPNIPKKLAIKPITINEMANSMIARSYYKTMTGRIHVHMTYETDDAKTSYLKLIVADTGSGDLTTLSGGHIDKIEVFNLDSLKTRTKKIKGRLDYNIRAGHGAEFTLMFPAAPWLPDPKKEKPNLVQNLKDLGQANTQNMIEIPLGDVWSEKEQVRPTANVKTAAPLNMANVTAKVKPETNIKTETKTADQVSEPLQDQNETRPPRTAAPQAPLKKTLADEYAKLSGLDALIVEDISSNRDVIRALLHPLEQKIITAHNGAEALKTLKTHIFDYIIMDIHMPDINGIEATQIIRQQDSSFANIPIIALTADTTIEVANDALVAGVDIVLTKPVTASTLFAAIETSRSCREAYSHHAKDARQNKRKHA